MGFIGGFGTMVSGLTFLTTALFITGLPVPISVLIIGIVIPNNSNIQCPTSKVQEQTAKAYNAIHLIAATLAERLKPEK